MTCPAQQPSQHEMRALIELYNMQQRKPAQNGLLNRLAMAYVAAIDDLIVEEHPDAARAEEESGSFRLLTHMMGNESAVATGRHAIVVLTDYTVDVRITVMANGREFAIPGVARFDIADCVRTLYGPSSFEEL